MIRMMGLVTLKPIGSPVGSYTAIDEKLSDKQKQLDVDKDGKIEGEDLAKLRKLKKDEALTIKKDAIGRPVLATKEETKKVNELTPPVSKDNPKPSMDHEVSMANNSLDDIIRDANELKTKLGEMEKDIPAWIQDHITNAANFISQAASNYHEHNTPDTEMEEGSHLEPSNDHKDPHKDPHMVHEDVCEGEGCEDMNEVSPEGWEGTVKAMKKYKKIDNPWALAYYMKSKGYKSHKKDK